MAAAPQATVKLHAHLDPTYTRDPFDPFKVTYEYSASATQTTQTALATTEAPAPLPSGVLALYSDGKLECAENVGGGVSGSECPVSYDKLGEHSVTTIYSSGEQSATETEVENIEPLGTTTTLRVEYSPFENPAERRTFDGEVAWELGVLTAQVGASPSTVTAQLGCESGDTTCARAFTVPSINVYAVIEEGTCNPEVGSVELGSYAPTYGEWYNGSRQQIPTEWSSASPIDARASTHADGYAVSDSRVPLMLGRPAIGC